MSYTRAEETLEGLRLDLKNEFIKNGTNESPRKVTREQYADLWEELQRRGLLLISKTDKGERIALMGPAGVVKLDYE